MTPEQKESFIKELEDAQMLKELEVLIQNLDDEQLENLEEILTDDIDHATEFEKIVKELRTMGLDEEDIEDLRQLATLMNQFLIQVPGLELKLEMKGGSDLLDNIQVQTESFEEACLILIINFAALSSWSAQQTWTSWLHRSAPCS